MGIINTVIDIMFPMKKVLEYGFMGLMLLIDGVVYSLISMLFSLFEALAGVQLLSNDIYDKIASTVYLFVGIIALFVLTFSLLKNLVDVDSTKNTVKSFKAIVVSLILIVLMPTIFKYGYSFQNAIISDGVIGKFFQVALSTDSKNENSMISLCNFSSDRDIEIKNINDENGKVSSGKAFAVSRMQCQANYTTMTILEGFLKIEDDTSNLFFTKWSDAKKYIIYSGNFNYIATFIKPIVDGKGATYIFIISTIAGLFCAYVILSFCIDVGVRAAKLAFYQLIAPIPILMSIIPNKQDMLNKWSKQTINCFLEVFVRLIIMNFIFFMCSNIFEIIDSLQGFENINLLGKAILALGLFSFGKQAPKLLKEALSLNGDGVKLGIKGKLEDNLAGKVINNGVNKFKGATTGALGAGWASMVNGGSFSKGAKYGALSGIKSGGNQFNAQRQGLYKDIGFKGKAGWFGGQAYFDKKLDDVKNEYKDNYYDNNLKNWIANQEATPEWQNIRDTKYNELVNEHNQKLAEANNQKSAITSAMNTEVASAQNQRDNDINNINNEFENEKLKLNQLPPDINIQQKLTELENSRNEKINNINSQFAENTKIINEKYAERLNSINDAIAKENDILAGKDVKVVNDKTGLLETYNINDKAKTAAVKEYGDLNETYKHRTTLYAKRQSEKEVSEYLKSEEGQKAIAVQKQAFDQSNNIKDLMNKQNKDKK